MGRESRRNRSRLADSARLGDDEAGDQIRILTRHVAIVIVVVEALAPLGVTVAGLKLHEAPVGRPEQVKLTC